LLLKKIQHTDVIDAISEIKKEMYEKEEIPLIVTEEQMDTLFSLFGYYGWYADEVNDTLVTHVNGITMTDDITESKKGTGEENHSSPPKQ